MLYCGVEWQLLDFYANLDGSIIINTNYHVTYNGPIPISTSKGTPEIGCIVGPTGRGAAGSAADGDTKYTIEEINY